MRPVDYARFLATALFWSIQFILMRMIVPLFGSPLVAEGRALFASCVVTAAALISGARIAPLTHWRAHLAIGVTNNVVPFACFAYGAYALPAGYLAIMNGMVPLFTAFFAAWKLKEPLGLRPIAGFLLGITGVTLIVNLGPLQVTLPVILAFFACLLGAASWAYAGIAIKAQSGTLPPLGLAAGSTLYSALIMSPTWLTAPQAAWTVESTVYLVMLGGICSGGAYLCLFSLIRDIGPSRAYATGYLVPVLGVAWGMLLLGEPLTLAMVAGGLLVLAAMALVLRR